MADGEAEDWMYVTGRLSDGDQRFVGVADGKLRIEVVADGKQCER